KKNLGIGDKREEGTMSESSKRLVWVVPEQRGGIHSYGAQLWAALQEAKAAGVDLVDIQFPNLKSRESVISSVEALKRQKPHLIHVQHEYGLFGSKLPFFYRFPLWLKEVRRSLPEAKVIATGHSVLGPDYRYPLQHRG